MERRNIDYRNKSIIPREVYPFIRKKGFWMKRNGKYREIIKAGILITKCAVDKACSTILLINN